MGEVEDYIDRMLEDAVVKRVAEESHRTEGHVRFSLFHCWLCGERWRGHDQAACDEKMANWKPTGLRGYLGDR